MPRLLVTTTSFQDTPGPHHAALEASGLEIIRARGPLTEEELLPLMADIDAMICGDDALTERVLAAAPRLKVLSKYGIGVDKIDVKAATARGLPVLFTPGVNHTTVAEHAFLLMLALAKDLPAHAGCTREGKWQRRTGHEIAGKRLGIFGLGRIGKEVAKRGAAFGMPLVAYDLFWDEVFAERWGVERAESPEALFAQAEVLSLHANLTEETRHCLNAESLKRLPKGAYVINCARGELVDTSAMVEALKSGDVGGYGTDVLEVEPPRRDDPLLTAPNCIVTPHIGSRTHESVQRQAGMAVENLLRALRGDKPLAQVNEAPLPEPILKRD